MEINRAFSSLSKKLNSSLPVDASFVPNEADIKAEKLRIEAELDRQKLLDNTLKRLVKSDGLLFLLEEKDASLLLASSRLDGCAFLNSDKTITIQRENSNKTYFKYQLRDRKPTFMTNTGSKNTDNFTDGGIFVVSLTNYYKPREYRNSPLSNEYCSGVFKGVTAEEIMETVVQGVNSLTQERNEPKDTTFMGLPIELFHK